jgi:hypothetical protein
MRAASWCSTSAGQRRLQLRVVDAFSGGQALACRSLVLLHALAIMRPARLGYSSSHRHWHCRWDWRGQRRLARGSQCERYRRRVRVRHTCHCECRLNRAGCRAHEAVDREPAMQLVGPDSQSESRTCEMHSTLIMVINGCETQDADTRCFYLSNDAILNSISMRAQKLFRIWHSGVWTSISHPALSCAATLSHAFDSSFEWLFSCIS